jgi:hypothetical protein
MTGNPAGFDLGENKSTEWFQDITSPEERADNQPGKLFVGSAFIGSLESFLMAILLSLGRLAN